MAGNSCSASTTSCRLLTGSTVSPGVTPHHAGRGGGVPRRSHLRLDVRAAPFAAPIGSTIRFLGPFFSAGADTQEVVFVHEPCIWIRIFEHNGGTSPATTISLMTRHGSS